MRILNVILNRIRTYFGLEKIDKNLEYYLENIKSWGGDTAVTSRTYSISKIESIVPKYYTGYTLWSHKTNYCSIDEFYNMKLKYSYSVIVDGSVYKKHFPEYGFDDNK